MRQVNSLFNKQKQQEEFKPVEANDLDEEENTGKISHLQNWRDDWVREQKHGYKIDGDLDNISEVAYDIENKEALA